MLEVVDPGSVGLSASRLARISTWLDQQISDSKLAGASALVARKGEVAYFETAGVADLDSKKSFAKDSIVRIYSMSKPITSVAVMMLYEQGCFQLDDPIHKYIPAFANTRVWTGGEDSADSTVPMKQPINVRHLLTHTSGLTYGFMRTNVIDASYREAGFEGPKESLQRWVDQLAEIPLICQPGSQWNYSVSTDVLGRLVEIWSGQTLDEFFRENIFEPLGMTDTAFFVSAENQSRFTALYSPLSGGALGGISNAVKSELEIGLKLQDKAEQSSYLSKPAYLSGGGGLTSTMHDYARFCQMLLNGGELDGQRLLGRKTVAYMRQNHLPDNKDMAAMGQPVWSESSYDGIGFGLGFAVVLDPVKASIITSVGEHHWGGAASTFFWLDAEEDLFVIFLTQLIPSSTYPIRRELRSRVYQALVD